jgi:hypothetical protein
VNSRSRMAAVRICRESSTSLRPLASLLVCSIELHGLGVGGVTQL